MTRFGTVLSRALLSAALIVPMAALAEPVTFETADGPMDLAETPKTIAAYDFGAIDTLVAMGHVPAGVPAPVYIESLKGPLADVPAIGSLFEPDYEALAAMQPDLVIVGSRSVKQQPDLEKLAPVANMSMSADAIGDGLARIEAYGQLFGEPEKAAQLEADITAKLEEAKAVVAEKGGKALIVLTNGPKVAAYGSGSRFGWLHDALGWPQAVENLDVATHGEAVSFEFIAEANPDTLIVVDRAAAIQSDAQNGHDTLNNELVQSTNAWKTGRVIYVPAAEMYISTGGYHSIMDTLQSVIDGLEGQGN